MARRRPAAPAGAPPPAPGPAGAPPGPAGAPVAPAGAPAGAGPVILQYVTRFTVVPHTHWDREWYRPFDHFRLELARVVDQVLDTLESDPDFTSFTLDGQAIVLEDYVEVRPENEARLRSLIQANRLETGPSYVLPDEFLVGGEALVRNLLIGRQVCERFGATPTPVGYLPDSFGHPLQLPQILAGFGIETFIFSRGMGDQLDDVGLIFRWRAPDGSEVLAFHQHADYGNFAAVRGIDDAEQRARSIEERFGPLLNRVGVDEVLLCNGTDHLPIQPEIPALCRELNRRTPGSTFELGTYSGYVRKATPAAPAPSWSGELLGSRLHNVLRGVNSARLYLKRANERAERRLLSLETIAALSALQTKTAFPVSDFRLAWRELLKCQPHDSICGCSCDEVHRDMMVRYEQLHRSLDVLQARALEPFAREDAEHRVGVVNPLPFRRTGLIELPGRAPAQIELAGFAATTVELEPAPRTEPDATATAIESDEFKLEAATDGTLTLTDKRTGRRFEGLHGYEDEPDAGDLYNFCPIDGAPIWRGGSAAARVLADGPTLWELELHTEADQLDLRTVVRLTRGSRRVEFRTTLENGKRDHRLRAVFPTGATDETVRAEGQFAVIHRPVTSAAPKTAWVEPPDPTQHTLGAVALGSLALLTKGLPEYEARGADLCLTLVRSVGLISQPSDAIDTRPLGAGPQTPTPEGQCLGRHHLEYALLLDADELSDAALTRASQDYRYGFVTTGAIEGWDPPVRIDSDAVFSCLKGAETGDGLILRCFNPSDRPAILDLQGPVSTARVRLDERRGDGDRVLRPGEIGTFELRTS